MDWGRHRCWLHCYYNFSCIACNWGDRGQIMKQQKFIFSKNYLLIETTGDVEMRCQEGGTMNLKEGKYCFFKRDFVYRGDTTLIGLVHLTFNYEDEVKVVVGEKWRVNLESLAEYTLDTDKIDELEKKTAALQDKDILIDKDIANNINRIKALENKTSTLQDNTSTTVRTATFNLTMYDTPDGFSYAVYVGDLGLSQILDFKIKCTCVGIKYSSDGKTPAGYTTKELTIPFTNNFNKSGYGDYNTIVRSLGGMFNYEHISEFVADCALLGYQAGSVFGYTQMGKVWQQQLEQTEVLKPDRAKGQIPNALNGDVLNATRGCLVFCLYPSMTVTPQTLIQATITYIGDKALSLTALPRRLSTTTQRILATISGDKNTYPYSCGWTSGGSDFNFYHKSFTVDTYLNNAYVDVQISNNTDSIPACRLFLQKREVQATTPTGITPILYTFEGCGENDIKNTYSILNGATETCINAKVELLLRSDEQPKLVLYLNAYTATKGENDTADLVKTTIPLDKGAQATVHLYGFDPPINL